SLADSDLQVVDARDLLGRTPHRPGRGEHPFAHDAHDIGWSEPERREPAVRQPSGHGEGPLAVRPQPDGDAAVGLRFHVRLLGSIAPTLIREVVFRPQPPDDTDGVLETV